MYKLKKSKIRVTVSRVQAFENLIIYLTALERFKVTSISNFKEQGNIQNDLLSPSTFSQEQFQAGYYLKLGLNLTPNHASLGSICVNLLQLVMCAKEHVFSSIYSITLTITYNSLAKICQLATKAPSNSQSQLKNNLPKILEKSPWHIFHSVQSIKSMSVHG